MTYKTLLTYADGYAPWADRAALAADIARNFDAHLTVAALGFDPEVPPAPYPAGYDNAYAEMLKHSHEETESRAEEVAAALDPEGVRLDVAPVAETYSMIGRRFARLARYADLTVFDPPYDGADVRTCHEIFEATVFGTDTPSLVCPAGTRTIGAESVLIAWNDSREALRAVRGALPFLRRAEEIEIAVIGHRASGMAPAEDLAVMLARQGATATITTLARDGDPVPDLLRQRLTDTGAGLLVMGAYGHSRFREYMIGGVSRDLLADPPVPLLIAH